MKQLTFILLFAATAFGQTQWITSYNSYETIPGSSGLQSGHGFVVPSTTDLPITALCRRVESGNTQTHTVQLYTPAHQAIPNTSVSVPTVGHSAGSWSCVDLATPYRTEAGLRYAVLSNENGPDQVSCGHITTTASASSAGWAWYEPGEDFWIDEPGDSCGTSMIYGTALTPGLRIVSQAAPTGAVGSAVGFDFVASGGTGGYQWSVISGVLPAGLSLASSGRLSGTPTTVQTLNYTVQVRDSANDTANRAFTQTILPTPGPTESDNRYCSVSGQWLGATTDQTIQLPQRCVYSARNATPSPGTVRSVAPGSSILTAVSGASCGDIIELQHGGTYGQISGLPNKNCDDAHWITIRSDAYQQLPPEGTRISPCYAGVSTLPGRPPYSCPSGGAQNLMAKIETRFNYDEAIRFAAGANHYRLIGLEVTRQQGTGLAPVYGLLYFADNVNKIIMDQMWIHGLDITIGNETVYAFSFGRSNAVAVVDSYFNDFFCLQGIGTCTDGSAMGGGLGTSDTWGNWKIVNNYIEGGGENMLFGGGGGSGPPPLDIEIRRNYLYKPLTWNRVMPQFTPYQGNGPQIKNIFELKRAGRVLFEGNILENNWPASDQGGQAVLYTAANQSDDQTTAMCPDCKVYDVVDRFNLITQAAGAIQMANVTYCSGHPSCTPAQLYSLSIHDNLYSHLRSDIACSGQWGAACINAFLPQVIDGRTTNYGSVFYNHITMVYDRIPNMLGYYDGPCNASHFSLKNSIIPAGLWGYGGGCGSGPSTPRMTGGFPGTAVFRNNMIVGATADGTTWNDVGGSSNTLQKPTNQAGVGFRNMAEDDYSLLPTSSGHNAAEDGKDMGADITALNAHIAGVRTGAGTEIPPQEISVTVSPASYTMDSETTHTFTATVHNHSNQAVTWQASQGSISSSGLFTAPTIVRRHPEILEGRGDAGAEHRASARSMNVTITATSVQDPTKSGTALVTVNPVPVPPGEPWSGILDPSRATDWRQAGIPAHDGLVRGIPHYTEVCAEIRPSGIRPWRPNTQYKKGDKITDSRGNLEEAQNDGISGFYAVDTLGIPTMSPAWPAWNAANGIATTENGGTHIIWHMNQRGTDTTEIRYWMNQCNNQSKVVQLTEGTYYIRAIAFGPAASWDQMRGPINRVVLRGAGADRTILKMYDVTNCNGISAAICVMGKVNLSTYNGRTAWTAGYAKGTNTITIASTAGLSRTEGASGNLIYLDQRGDMIGLCNADGSGTGPCTGVPGATQSGNTVTIHTSFPHHRSVGDCVGIALVAITGYRSHYNPGEACNNESGWFKVTAVPSDTSFEYELARTGLAPSGGGRMVPETGGLLLGSAHGPVNAEAGGHGRACSLTNNQAGLCATGEITWRPNPELHKVIDFNSSTGEVTIDPPVVQSNFRSSQTPGVFWAEAYAIYDGVEDLTIDNSEVGIPSNQNAWPGTGGSVLLYQAYGSWVKNVRSIGGWYAGFRAHIRDVWGGYNEFTNNYLFNLKFQTSTAYGFETGGNNTGDLVQNNICQHVVACILTTGTIASVYGYNFSFDGAYGDGLHMIQQLNLNHEFGLLNLAEGNNTNLAQSDNIHGTGGFMTFFRNRTRGQDTPIKSSSIGNAIRIDWGTRANNVIANIMGTDSVATGMSGVLNLGVRSTTNEGTTLSPDHFVIESNFSWGNFEGRRNIVRWCGNASNTGWATTCYGILSATYISGGTISQTPVNCWVSFATPPGAFQSGGFIVPVHGAIPPNTPIIFGTLGSNWSGPAPTSATLSSNYVGGGTCSGTIQVHSELGSVSEIPPGTAIPTVGDTQAGQPPLPASFYLNAKPSWWTTTWGTPGWPAIGPDVNATGSLNSTCSTTQNDAFALSCDGIADHTYQIPAQICYNHLPVDNTYQKRFVITASNYVSNVDPGGGATGPGIEFRVNNTLYGIGDTVQITGVTPSQYNGMWQVFKRTATTVTVRGYTGLLNLGTGSGGSMTYPNIKLYDASRCYPNEARSQKTTAGH